MKIAFIALSGIRVCDQELLDMGLTLPGFVERSKTIASLPSLGLLTLAGATPKHHQLKYFEYDSPADLPQLIEQVSDFDLVAVSSFSAQIYQAYQLGKSLLQRKIPVVMGGLHVTVLPQEAIKYCDAVIIGEGELVWPQVVLDVEKNQLKPFYQAEQEFNMADAPMPAFELLDISKYNRLTIQTCRGCTHRCDFCASSILLTRKYKQKPVEKILAEIDKIKSIWAKPFIEFADDNTLVNRHFWKTLLPELKKRHVRWFCETDISIARDDELLQLMRESGCAQVLIGLESPTAVDIDGIELHNNWKARQCQHYRQAIANIQKHGISVNGCFILGLDNHTVEIFDDVFAFVKSSGLHEVQITFQTPFPGTPLYQRLASEGRIIDLLAWEKCTLFDVNYLPANMSVKQLTKGFKKLTQQLYSQEFTALRKQHFHRQFLAARHE
jgi:radical SAM superfamily enzyme YgiQ (UPF0313 family)